MGRSPCCSKEELNRGAWTTKEDMILSEYIRTHGDAGWKNLPLKAGLKRSGQSCRLRWLDYLRPDIKRGNISPDEDDLIIRLHRLLGNRWSLIAGRLPERTANEIKNYWKTHLSKKLLLMNQSQPNLGTENLKKRKSSCSRSPLQNHVYIPTPSKIITAASQSEIVRSNGFNGSGYCSIRNSHKDLESCNAKETRNSITYADAEAIAEARSSTCPMSTLVDGRWPESDYFAGDAGALAQNLLDWSELSSADCNLLSSPSEFFEDFGVEEFFTGSAAEAIEFEIFCSDQTNMQRLNYNFTFSNGPGVEDFDGNRTYGLDS